VAGVTYVTKSIKLWWQRKKETSKESRGLSKERKVRGGRDWALVKVGLTKERRNGGVECVRKYSGEYCGKGRKVWAGKKEHNIKGRRKRKEAV